MLAARRALEYICPDLSLSPFAVFIHCMYGFSGCKGRLKSSTSPHIQSSFVITSLITAGQSTGASSNMICQASITNFYIVLNTLQCLLILKKLNE